MTFTAICLSGKLGLRVCLATLEPLVQKKKKSILDHYVVTVFVLEQFIFLNGEEGNLKLIPLLDGPVSQPIH